MEAIIDKIVAKFKREAREFFEGDRKDIEAAEAFFVPRLSAMVTELLSGLYEEADEALLADRAGRRQSGLTVERRGDQRRVLFRTIFCSSSPLTARRTHSCSEEGISRRHWSRSSRVWALG